MGALKNIRQERFCQKYLECGVAVEAMLHAYPSRKKWKRKAQDNAAYTLLQNREILGRLEELRQKDAQKAEITRESILEELRKIGFSSLADCHSDWGEVLDFDKLTADQRAAIKSISARKVKLDSGEIVENIHIEMHDKIKALERICKMLGYDSAAEVKVARVSELSREEKLAELARLEKLRKG